MSDIKVGRIELGRPRGGEIKRPGALRRLVRNERSMAEFVRAADRLLEVLEDSGAGLDEIIGAAHDYRAARERLPVPLLRRLP